MEREEIQSFRDHNNDRLPFWYDWKLHVLCNLSFILFAALLALLFIQKFSIIIFLGSLVAWGIIEYAIHRFVLHGKKDDLKLKIEHSGYHHNYFTKNEMNAKKLIDLNRVFLMPLDLFTVIFLALVLSAFLLPMSESICATFFLAGIIHITAYEVIHGLCHFEFSKNYPKLDSLIHHHVDHHELEKMSATNFSVVYPFIDTWFGTRYKRGQDV